ncbi:MAG: antitoxin Xre/MbcA/ParS toxin-binding domain-containing protein, partial [Beijerinckiaceae bacterium]
FSCGDGWLPILEDLFVKIDEVVKSSALTRFKVEQVKEKFGDLMVYVAGENNAIAELIATAAERASVTCEDCGKPGQRRTLNEGKFHEWLRTLCDECFAIRPYRLTETYALAVEVLGGAENARKWLLAPHFSFQGKSPLEMLKTDEGAKDVDVILAAIRDGASL